MNILFESVSAYCTVGLSLGLTPELSPAGKWIVIILMFTGRVGSLTLLTGLVQSIRKPRYNPIDYPEEEIFIT